MPDTENERNGRKEREQLPDEPAQAADFGGEGTRDLPPPTIINYETLEEGTADKPLSLDDAPALPPPPEPPPPPEKWSTRWAEQGPPPAPRRATSTSSNSPKTEAAGGLMLLIAAVLIYFLFVRKEEQTTRPESPMIYQRTQTTPVYYPSQKRPSLTAYEKNYVGLGGRHDWVDGEE
jgi:hypothetical protein